VTKTHVLAVGLGVLAVVALSSCASYRYTRQADDAIRAENWDAAVYYYLEALARDPGNVHFKMGLERSRLKAAEDHFKRGMVFKNAGDLERAQSELELAVELDPTHQYAEVELAKVRNDLAVLSQKNGAAKLAEMKREASEMKVKPPALNPASNEPLSLSFPTERSVKDIYKAIGQAFGINILFDPKLRDSKLSIELKDVTARQALEAVMEAAGDFYKVLDPKTVIVVEDTPQNRRDYEDLVVKTFFLSNADVKDINNMLRALIDARRIAVNEQLNAIVIRDTADKVAIAERLINANDKAKAEVLVDVELLQVNTTKLRDLGMTLVGPGSTNYSYGFSVDPSKLNPSGTSSSTTTVPLSSLNNITRSMWLTTLPSLSINLIKSAGEAETLAQPQLRITEHEKASLLIGDKVPIPTTTFNTSSTVGGNIVPITAFQYQDVGIKLEIEPRVHHNNEVTLKLKVEVSELGAQITVATGQTQPEISTRTIDSVIRLKDGETSLLAGLLKVSKQTSHSGIPWLSDLPIVGALFGDNSKNLQQTDLVLTLTPHIIRYPDITEEDLAPLWVGTENHVSIFGNSPRVRSAVSVGPFGGGEGGERGAESRGEEGVPNEGDQGIPGVGESNPRAGQGKAPGLGQPWRPIRRGVTPGSTSPGDASQSDVSALPTGDQATSTTAEQTANATAAQTASATAASTAASEPTESAPGTAPIPAEAELTRVTFYPARVPVIMGREGNLAVVLDPGAGGATGPLNFAYDPAKLEVLQAEGGNLPSQGHNVHVSVTQTPALGWITVNWNGEADGSGTLLNLTVRPHTTGELPIVFAGPSSAAIATPATVVALPTAAAGGGGEARQQ
jgi:general secretion pathway protein D